MRAFLGNPVARLLVLMLAVALSGAVVATPPAAAAQRWAPAATAKIHPGVQMFTKGAQCTGNFVFTDRRGRVYVGYAAHCAGTGAATDTEGCTSASVPLGTEVRFAAGATAATSGTTVGRGRLVYSSWITMRRREVTNPAACAHNDFALVRVGAAHVGKVNPSVPFWGGPVALAGAGPKVGSRVFSYGSSSLRPGELLSPKTGLVVENSANGWSHDVYTVTTGVPGDSGSAFLDAGGRALGTLSTLAVAPLPASNGVGDLPRELRFARNTSGIAGLRLVPGTVAFDPVP